MSAMVCIYVDVEQQIASFCLSKEKGNQRLPRNYLMQTEAAAADPFPWSIPALGDGASSVRVSGFTHE